MQQAEGSVSGPVKYIYSRSGSLAESILLCTSVRFNADA